MVDVGAGVQFRVMLINVNSRTGDPARVMAAIRAEDPDVLLLEELSERWRPLVDVLSQSYRGRCIDLREDNFGIGLFSRFGMQEQEIVQVGMTPVPTALASIGLGGEEIVVIGTHPLPPAGRAYSAGRNDHLAKLPRFVDAGRATVLMGDLNTTPWNGHFRVLLDESGLKDTSRGWGVQPTWPVANILLRIPLDHCLVSDRIVVLDRRIGGDVGSDHFPLIVDLVLLPSSE